MNKRARVSKYVFFGVLLVVILAFCIAGFIVPAYSSVFTSLLSPLLCGCFFLFTGIKQMQKTKAHGVRIPWWKQHRIIFGLAFECFAAIVLWTNLTTIWSNNVFFSSTYLLVVLLSLSLLIYGFILMFQQAARRRDLINPKKANRKVR